jgi:ABC-type sugar transport system ATPase subunit
MGTITLNQVTKSFGDVLGHSAALDSKINDGEFVVFVGPRAAASPRFCG